MLNRELDERVFVKNFENVQGDERDIILFSITFAKNEEGKVNNRFGDLNKKGGENRLNVAVSMAKKESLWFLVFKSESDHRTYQFIFIYWNYRIKGARQ